MKLNFSYRVVAILYQEIRTDNTGISIVGTENGQLKEYAISISDLSRIESELIKAMLDHGDPIRMIVDNQTNRVIRIFSK